MSHIEMIFEKIKFHAQFQITYVCYVPFQRQFYDLCNVVFCQEVHRPLPFSPDLGDTFQIGKLYFDYTYQIKYFRENKLLNDHDYIFYNAML